MSQIEFVTGIGNDYHYSGVVSDWDHSGELWGKDVISSRLARALHISLVNYTPKFYANQKYLKLSQSFFTWRVYQCLQYLLEYNINLNEHNLYTVTPRYL